MTNSLTALLAYNCAARGIDPKVGLIVPAEDRNEAQRNYTLARRVEQTDSNFRVMFFRHCTTTSVEHALIPNQSVLRRYKGISS